MNPAVGRVALNGLPDLPSLSQSARQTNLNWQDQVRQRNQEWLVFVADRNGSGYGIEAFDHRIPVKTSAGPRMMATTAVKSAGNLGDQSLKLLADPYLRG